MGGKGLEQVWTVWELALPVGGPDIGVCSAWQSIPKKRCRERWFSYAAHCAVIDAQTLADHHCTESLFQQRQSPSPTLIQFFRAVLWFRGLFDNPGIRTLLMQVSIA